MHEATILIVDDHEQIRKLVARHLALAHIRSEPAACAEDAMDRIARGGISLALIDLALGEGESGTDLLAAIRGMEPELPVVFFTGNPAMAEDHPDVPLILKDAEKVSATMRELVVTIKWEIRNRCRDIRLKETHDLAGDTHKILTDVRNILAHPDTGLAATHSLALTASKRGLGELAVEALKQPLVWGLVAFCGLLIGVIMKGGKLP